MGKIETIDTGKLFKETKNQANYIAEYYDYYAGLADKVEGTVVDVFQQSLRIYLLAVFAGLILISYLITFVALGS